MRNTTRPRMSAEDIMRARRATAENTLRAAFEHWDSAPVGAAVNAYPGVGTAVISWTTAAFLPWATTGHVAYAEGETTAQVDILCEILRAEGYQVTGAEVRASTTRSPDTWRWQVGAHVAVALPE